MNNFFLFSFGLRIVGEEYKKKKKKPSKDTTMKKTDINTF